MQGFIGLFFLVIGVALFCSSVVWAYSVNIPEEKKSPFEKRAGRFFGKYWNYAVLGFVYGGIFALFGGFLLFC